MLEEEEEEGEENIKEKDKKFTGTPIEDDCLGAWLHRCFICCCGLNRLMCT